MATRTPSDTNGLGEGGKGVELKTLPSAQPHDVTTPATAPRLGIWFGTADETGWLEWRVWGCGIPALSARTSQPRWGWMLRPGTPLSIRLGLWGTNVRAVRPPRMHACMRRKRKLSRSVSSRRVWRPNAVASASPAWKFLFCRQSGHAMVRPWEGLRMHMMIMLMVVVRPVRPSASAARECAEGPSSLGCSCQDSGSGRSAAEARKPLHCPAS
ncbi:hypothetical protein IWX90DRAFT_218281 [Phyllosticta citrichinensis]|uniref:Uncharacterized protein n=1 Tax=Phyllosticta citrichinensis TaxID=1130410 RepID=A0ABR1XTV6_9PEZI